MSPGRAISSRARWALFSAQLAALVAILVITNPGVVERLDVILTMNERWWLMVPIFLALWAAGLVALAATMLLPNIWARAFWAFVIALSGALGFGFYLVSETELSIFDVVSLWNARHEAGRALAFYQSSLAGAAAIFVVTLIVLVLPPPPLMRFARVRRWLVVVPLVPIILYAGVIVYRGGDGSRALPAQFAPVSIGALAANKIATNTMPLREEVPWTAGRAQTKHIVLLVDESIRADFIDWRNGNPYTPQIAGHQDRIVNFGPAASGGNCSHYANAILRFGGTRHALTQTMLTNATLWRYAKQAGYRTVFIDAQAAFMRNGGYSGKFQNFMSAEEAADIDDFHALSGEAHELDGKLLDIVLKDLRGDQPVFIYAVKNGAHFPYDADYPESAAEFRPTMAERGRDDTQARINSYRNAIRWNVDRFFARLFSEADLRNSAHHLHVRSWPEPRAEKADPLLDREAGVGRRPCAAACDHRRCGAQGEVCQGGAGQFRPCLTFLDRADAPATVRLSADAGRKPLWHVDVRGQPRAGGLHLRRCVRPVLGQGALAPDRPSQRRGRTSACRSKARRR